MAIENRCPNCGSTPDRPNPDCPRHGRPDQVRERPSPWIGKRIAERFLIQHKIGEGGMGTVFQALDQQTNTEVAIKVVRPELAADATLSKRFLREAKTVSQLKHPNTIKVLAYGQSGDGPLYMAMELLHGQTLTALIEERPLSLRRAAHIMAQVCDSLAEAHAQGIVHRDLKPGNIHLVPGPSGPDEVRVLDFGVAQVQSTGNDTKLTKIGSIPGTPLYLSPEAAAGAQIDHRADIYALGAILFEMLAGSPPFFGTSGIETILMHINQPPPTIRSMNRAASVNEATEQLVKRMLAKAREDRPASVTEVRDAILAGAKELAAASALPTGPAPRVDVLPGPRTAAPSSATVKLPAVDPTPRKPEREADDEGGGGTWKWWALALLLLGGASWGAWYYFIRGA